MNPLDRKKQLKKRFRERKENMSQNDFAHLSNVGDSLLDDFVRKSPQDHSIVVFKLIVAHPSEVIYVDGELYSVGLGLYDEVDTWKSIINEFKTFVIPIEEHRLTIEDLRCIDWNFPQKLEDMKNQLTSKGVT